MCENVKLTMLGGIYALTSSPQWNGGDIQQLINQVN